MVADLASLPVATGCADLVVAGWALGLAGSAAGLGASALWDLPTGASIVVAFGALFLACAIVHGLKAAVAAS